MEVVGKQDDLTALGNFVIEPPSLAWSFSRRSAGTDGKPEPTHTHRNTASRKGIDSAADDL